MFHDDILLMSTKEEGVRGYLRRVEIEGDFHFFEWGLKRRGGFQGLKDMLFFSKLSLYRDCRTQNV